MKHQTRVTIVPMREVFHTLPHGVWRPPGMLGKASLRQMQQEMTNVGLGAAFLSYIKLSMYTTVVAVAIVLSFHLKSEPSQLERQIATPLGAVFWVLSFAVLLVGLSNYIGTYQSFVVMCHGTVLPLMST